MNENHRILIVDDEMIIVRDIEQIVRKMGFVNVRFANSGAEAVRVARKFKPMTILFDINLNEELDGIARVAEIQEFLHTQVIYITAFSNTSILEKAFGTNPANYIVKPFEQRQVEIAIQMLVNSPNDDELGTLKTDYMALLSDTEKKIVNLIAKNQTTAEIAETLFLSPKTVENNRYNICKKLALPAEKNSLIKWVFANKNKLEP